jgi:hypothetical protein
MKFIICFLLAWPLISIAQKTSPAARSWPLSIAMDGANDVQLEVYQPQVESLVENKVQALAAFKVKKDKKDYLGTFVLEARSTLDKKTNVASLSDFKISKINLSAKGVDNKVFAADLEKKLNQRPVQISNQSLVDSLAATQSTSQTNVPNLKNDPPDFIFVQEPTILIMISGEPKWTPSAGAPEVERVINSSALFLHQPKKNEYFLWALGKWFMAPDISGPYKVSKGGPSSKFVIVKDKLVKEKTVDPLSGKQKNGSSIFPEGMVPNIIVRTKPSELLQSTGEPTYEPIPGTSLLYVSNSPNSIFLDSSTQKYIVVVTGRWFEASSLKGPFTFLDGKKLPKDFAKIPASSPVAEVLVSVPGTSQAQQAVAAIQAPQTAQVPKNLKAQNVECDGSIKWVKIMGTSLQSAQNCNTPLIEVQKDSYYIIQDGVWFTSNSPKGPWIVAIAVPAEIYKIPTSSLLFYVTYVRVYGATDDMVIVGYTPGYKGTFVSADGTVVYGTGYVYPSYVSSAYWYPAPSTYGYGAGYGWGMETGFYMGFTMGSMMYPWGWGGCCYGPPVNIDIDINYNRWGKQTVISGPTGRSVTATTIGQTKFIHGNMNDDLYATHGGQVYRKTDSGWQRNVGPGNWTDVDKGNIDRNNVNNLDREHNARHVNSLPTGPTAQPRPEPSRQNLNGGNARAGGFRGGGGGFRR